SPAGSQPGRSGRGRARASAYAMRSRTPGHSRANCARTPRQEDAGEVRDVQREGALRREGAPRGGVHGRPPGEHVHQRAALRVAAAVVLAHSARAVAASGREGPPGDPHGGGPVLGGRRRCSPLDPVGPCC
ncbi:unnamed protein product, partial [Prorocentrum cordatum]